MRIVILVKTFGNVTAVNNLTVNDRPGEITTQAGGFAEEAR